MSERFAELLARGPVAVNVGIRDFAETLRVQGGEVVDVEWTPPAEGDPELLEILDRLL
ncbi:MAG TPA: hypothetical protein VGR87_03815 [Candidatus Limnocylindria bacterium]|nr:hypothetical protein [Candidatus Limnocylindria bacterium]